MINENLDNPYLDNENMRLREVSGEVVSSSNLQYFLYLLLRDNLTSGSVEKLVRDATRDKASVLYCNGWLANYAADIAARLTK